MKQNIPRWSYVRNLDAKKKRHKQQETNSKLNKKNGKALNND